MSSKGALLSAGAGAIVAMAGVYIARKVKGYVTPRRPRMRLFHNNLFMSTRCAWLIAELGVEDEIDFRPTDKYDDPRYCSNDCLILELESLPGNKHQNSLHYPSVRQEEDYQVLVYSPYVSSENLTLGGANAASDGSCPESLTESYSSQSCCDELSGADNSSPVAGAMQRSIIVNGEFTMIEGAAICMYLADLYGQFLPDAEHRAEYYSWIVYSAATFDNLVKTLHNQMVELPESQRNKVTLDSALSGFHAFARALSETLAHNKHLCGDNFTAADCVLGFTLWWAYTIDEGRLLDGYPALSAYLHRLQARPAFEKTFGRDEQWDWARYFRTYLTQIEYL